MENPKFTRAEYIKEQFDSLNQYEQIEFAGKIFMSLDEQEQANIIYEYCSQRFKERFIKEKELYNFYINPED